MKIKKIEQRDFNNKIQIHNSNIIYMNRKFRATVRFLLNPNHTNKAGKGGS